MKFINKLLLIMSFLSTSVSAANDVYGTVDELYIRSGGDDDSYLAFRINVLNDISNFESCVIDRNNLVWKVDVSSPVSKYQYDIIKESYTNKLPIRIIGQHKLCDKGNVYSDKVYELSPWIWDYHLQEEDSSSRDNGN